jgi:hypothetical protein
MNKETEVLTNNKTKMNNEDISPVILYSIELMKKTNDGLEIEILGEMKYRG